MRVLITGSRDWVSFKTVRDALFEAHKVLAPGDEFIIVHGNCPTGADAMAEQIAHRWSWKTEKYPAEWDRYGKAAGFHRNNLMVKAGADVCLAFIKDGSRGATHCAMAAAEAGIPVMRFEC